ncbi:hypothetical protein HY251_04345 [bacterium]|nr:hypothetical protein [bacterium]
MEGFNQERRGLFDGLKVPFDVNAILLAALGIVVFQLGIWGIELVLEIPFDTLLHGVLASVLAKVPVFGGDLARAVSGSHEKTEILTGAWLAVFVWSSVVWAFFSGAICRIAAMKIAREEGLELKDALRFAANKFMPNLLSIAFVLAIVGFFYVICDATIAGWIGRIPYLGDILVGLLFFLVLLSSFFIVFAAVLGILGFNLAAAAIATEASDTFDGVSRAWNYILARPWQVLLTYALTFAYIAVFLFCGHVFLRVSVKSLSIGNWGMGRKTQIIPADGQLANKIGGIREKQRIAVPGKAEFLYRRLVIEDPVFTQKDPVTKQDVLLYPQVEPDTGKPIGEVGPDGNEVPLPPGAPVRKVNVWPALDSSLIFASGVIWLWLVIAKLLIFAYLVSYFFSAMTKVYFLLRKDVEGDDYTEINLEEEDEDEESFEYGEHAERKEPPKPHEGGKALPVVSGGPSGAAPAGEKKEEKH